MTRLQKAALAGLLQPVVIAVIFLAILLFFGGERPLFRAIYYSSLVYALSICILSWRQKREHRVLGDKLDELEKEIVYKAFRSGYYGILGALLISFVIVAFMSDQRGADSVSMYLVFLIVIGSILTGNIAKAVALFHYTRHPQDRRPMKFPGI
jgi:hypothetical protein